MNISINEVLEALKSIKNPASKKNIVEADLVKTLSIENKKISFVIDLPVSPFKKSIKKASEKVLRETFGEEIETDIKFTERKGNEVSVGRTDDGSTLPKIKNIIAVASGKGGVGKSTISANLAVALSRQGAKVGLLDADIYGPSQTKMFGVEKQRPEVVKKDGKDLILPVDVHGIKLLSIGFFIKPEDALIWRGAMATGALQQLINDTEWGDLDYLVIDMPPGTGDIHLTLVQTVPVTGAIIVSTPQDVAIADAIRGINMFRAEKIEVPILGLVENMAWFTPAELPENKYYLFGKEGLKKLAEKENIPLLGQIPIVQSVCEDGDKGMPSVLNEESIISAAFTELATNTAKAVENRNKTLDPTKVVQITS